MTDEQAARIAALKPGKDYRHGTRRPYRPCPPDFREYFLKMGWDGIDEHFHANWPCIARWVRECGDDELRQARAAESGHALPTIRRRSALPSYQEAVDAIMAAAVAKPSDNLA